MDIEPGKHLILYDGVCGLCNAFVRFVIKIDKQDHFRFTPLQGEAARAIVARHGADPDQISTLYLVAFPGQPEEEVWTRGRAALKVITKCGGAWKLLMPFGLLPDFLLNLGYRAIARVRYLIAGRKELCELPSPDDRHRFVSFPEPQDANPAELGK